MSERSWRGIATPALRYPVRPGVSPMPTPGLLVGEYPVPSDAGWLRQEHGIEAVVCLQDEFDLAAKQLELATLAEAYRQHGVEFHHLPVTDGDAVELAVRLPAILDVLASLVGAGRRVYLHCNAGFNRAPTVAIAFLRMHGGMTLLEAWRAVKSRRSCVPYRRALGALFPGEDMP